MSDAALAPALRPGDTAEWLTREGDTTVKRVVRVESIGPSEAIVRWGMRSDGDGKGEPYRFSAPLRELRPPAGPEPMPWGLKPVATPRPPEPPSTADLATRLATRRDQLRAAHDRAAIARDAVAVAREAADLARRECDTARAELATAAAHDQRAEDAFAEAIRRREKPTYSNGIDLPALRRTVEVAETAQRKFDAELAAANAKLTEAMAAVRAAAAAVLSSVLGREVERLRVADREAAALRTRLCAAAEIWLDTSGPIKLDHAAASYLADWPQPPEQVGGYDARAAHSAALAAPFKRLHDRLVAGDADADLETEQ